MQASQPPQTALSQLPLLVFSDPEKHSYSKYVIDAIRMTNKQTSFRYCMVEEVGREGIPKGVTSVPTLILPSSGTMLVGVQKIMPVIAMPMETRRNAPTQNTTGVPSFIQEPKHELGGMEDETPDNFGDDVGGGNPDLDSAVQMNASMITGKMTSDEATQRYNQLQAELDGARGSVVRA
jgi:hypothetical protein